MTSFGVVFNIEAIGGGLYGYSAYRVLFSAVGQHLLTSCSLRDGDISNNHYCIAIESDNPMQIAELRKVLAACSAKGLMPSPQRFLDGAQVDRLPLVQAAYITSAGELAECTTGWLVDAWKDVRKIPPHMGDRDIPDIGSRVPGEAKKTLPDFPPTKSLFESTKTLKKSLRFPEVSPDKPTGQGEYAPDDVMGQRYYVRSVHRGGMGLVYIVDSLTSLQKGKSLLLALKTFQDRFLWDEEAIQRFEREALQWIDLEIHTNIVSAYLVERIEGRPYIWLEYVDGESLAERLSREKLNAAQTINFAYQFISGMRHAWEKHGLIHRDIKPANCMLTMDGVLKISDFGLSKLRAELQAQTNAQTTDDEYTTHAGVLVGTPAYMPPEVILDPANADARSDIYSFGVMLYEMLSGRVPFRGSDILKQHLQAKPVNLRSSNPAVPPELERMVLKCLEKEPAKRFASFEELEAALKQTGNHIAGAIPQTPESTSLEPKDHWFMKAFTWMEFGRYEEAINAFRKVLLIAPDEAEAHNNIGLCLVQLGHLDEACQSARRAVELRPDYVEAWSNLGGFSGRMGRFEEGVAACDRATAINPEWAEAHANRGANLTGLGRFEEAERCFEHALKKDPKYWKAYVMAAESLASRGGEPSKVLALVERAIEIQPRDAGALALAAACLKDLGRTDDAIHFLTLAAAVDPHNPMVRRVQEALRRSQQGHD